MVLYLYSESPIKVINMNIYSRRRDTEVQSFNFILIALFSIQTYIAFTGWDTNNKYIIRNAAGQQCFYAVEGRHFFQSFSK